MLNPIMERFGGTKGVSRIVFRFYDLILESDRLRPFFDGVDMSGMVEHQTTVALSAIGGERSYSRGDLIALHAHLTISPTDFDEMLSLLEQAAIESGVSQQDAQHLLRYYAGYRDDMTRNSGSETAPA